MAKKWNGERVANKVGREIQLEDDLILDEIRNADDMDDAINRLEAVRDDAEAALRVIEDEFGGGDAKKNPPKFIKCKCGARVELSHYDDNECEKCGQPYNAFGQRLRRGHDAECNCSKCSE